MDRTPTSLRDRMHELLDRILTASSPRRAREAVDEACDYVVTTDNVRIVDRYVFSRDEPLLESITDLKKRAAEQLEDEGVRCEVMEFLGPADED